VLANVLVRKRAELLAIVRALYTIKQCREQAPSDLGSTKGRYKGERDVKVEINSEELLVP
jgi:hypothetical protein